MLSTREPADAYGAPAATRIISRFTRSSFKTHVSLRFGANDPLSRGQQTFSCKGSDSTCLGPHRPDQPCSTSSALPLPWESAGGRCAGLGLVSAHQTTSGTRGRQPASTLGHSSRNSELVSLALWSVSACSPLLPGTPPAPVLISGCSFQWVRVPAPPLLLMIDWGHQVQPLAIPRAPGSRSVAGGEPRAPAPAWLWTPGSLADLVRRGGEQQSLHHGGIVTTK